MWVALKDEQPALAWDALIEAGTSARNAIRAHPIAQHLESYVEKLDALEKLLFPPMIFVSIGIIVHESRCTICGSEYGECEHIKGMVYMGQICSCEITKCDIYERSIVPDPANKHARMIVISDDDIMRDLLTWRPLPQFLPGDDIGELS
jgi:hypothetical protein